MPDREKTLEDRIREEMTVDYKDALERNFDLAKTLVAITSEGKISIKQKERFTGEEQISLYLIGRVYASRAGYTANEKVGTKELLDELSIKKGSLLPWLKTLRDKGIIKSDTDGKLSYHYIPHNLIEPVLNNILTKQRGR